ncbi:pyridoxine 5'-phosphate synthase [Thermovibrio sp.]
MRRKVRLGVNIDHVATVRNARKTFEPDPVHAAVIADLAGADQITLHVREDRRHVNERDLKLIKELIHSRVNLEMAITDEMIKIAKEVKPHQATLVPEKRQEITTEGGLDVLGSFERVKEAVKELKEAGITVNIFIDPDKRQIEKAKETGADAVELHTGRYAEAFAKGDEKEVEEELKRIREAARFAKELGLKVYAGHGLTYKNVRPVAQIEEIEELNIGHSIVANAILLGLKEAVEKMIKLING